GRVGLELRQAGAAGRAGAGKEATPRVALRVAGSGAHGCLRRIGEAPTGNEQQASYRGAERPMRRFTASASERNSSPAEAFTTGCPFVTGFIANRLTCGVRKDHC